MNIPLLLLVRENRTRDREIRPVEEELTNTGRTRGQHTDETYEYLHRLNMHTTDNVLFLLDGGSIQSPRAAHIRPRTNSGYSAPKPPREYLAGLHRVNELTWDWQFSNDDSRKIMPSIVTINFVLKSIKCGLFVRVLRQFAKIFDFNYSQLGELLFSLIYKSNLERSWNILFQFLTMSFQI